MRAGWARLLGGPGRIVGVDLARGLALLGMVAAHLRLGHDELIWSRPSTYLGIVDGRSSILFATLAGLSIGLISGRTKPVSGPKVLEIRLKIVVRAMVIFAIGAVLQLLGTQIAIILQQYAVLFVCTLPVLRWPAKKLLGLAAAWALIMPTVTTFIALAITGGKIQGFDALTDLVVRGTYPAMIWFAFTLTGLAIGRMDLTVRATQVKLLIGGGVCVIGGYVLGEASRHVWPKLQPFDPFGPLPPWEHWFARPFLGAEAHSGSTWEVIGSGGFAVLVIALCLLASSWARYGLCPVIALGSMTLTFYTIHVISVFFLGLGTPQNPLWLSIIIGLVAATAWRFFFGRGPIERFVAWVARSSVHVPQSSS